MLHALNNKLSGLKDFIDRFLHIFHLKGSIEFSATLPLLTKHNGRLNSVALPRKQCLLLWPYIQSNPSTKTVQEMLLIKIRLLIDFGALENLTRKTWLESIYLHKCQKIRHSYLCYILDINIRQCSKAKLVIFIKSFE